MNTVQDASQGRHFSRQGVSIGAHSSTRVFCPLSTMHKRATPENTGGAKDIEAKVYAGNDCQKRFSRARLRLPARRYAPKYGRRSSDGTAVTNREKLNLLAGIGVMQEKGAPPSLRPA
jgi:hypothetical protein